jgi:hypothetical protein
MPFEKGRTKVGGRQKGSVNKATAAKAEAIASSGLTPLEFMIRVMRDPTHPADFRLDAAKSAAPYIHPKLSSVLVKGDADEPLEVHHTVDAFTSRIARLSARNAEDEGDSEA